MLLKTFLIRTTALIIILCFTFLSTGITSLSVRAEDSFNESYEETIEYENNLFYEDYLLVSLTEETDASIVTAEPPAVFYNFMDREWQLGDYFYTPGVISIRVNLVHPTEGRVCLFHAPVMNPIWSIVEFTGIMPLIWSSQPFTERINIYEEGWTINDFQPGDLGPVCLLPLLNIGGTAIYVGDGIWGVIEYRSGWGINDPAYLYVRRLNMTSERVLEMAENRAGGSTPIMITRFTGLDRPINDDNDNGNDTLCCEYYPDCDCVVYCLDCEHPVDDCVCEDITYCENCEYSVDDCVCEDVVYCPECEYSLDDCTCIVSCPENCNCAECTEKDCDCEKCDCDCDCDEKTGENNQNNQNNNQNQGKGTPTAPQTGDTSFPIHLFLMLFGALSTGGLTFANRKKF